MSEEQQWLTCLSLEQLVQACKEAGVKVDGFRQLAMVPRLLLERQVSGILSKPWLARSQRLRTALRSRWQERYAALNDALLAGAPAGEGEEPDPASPTEWLAGLSRQFGRAPVLAGLYLTDVVDLSTTDLSGLEQGNPAIPEEQPPEEAPPNPEAGDAEAAPIPEEEGESRPEGWRQERALLRAKLKAATQENQALQKARISAEHRAAHYQSQVERLRAEMETLAGRTDWPRPTMLVQRLIRGLMEARRQILDLEQANADLLAELGRSRPTPDADAESEEL